MVNDLVIADLVEKNGWYEVQNSLTTSCGKIIDVQTDEWHLPYAIWKSTTLDFNKVDNIYLRWALRSYVTDALERVSVHSGYSNFKTVISEILKHSEIIAQLEGEHLKDELITLFEQQISKARAEHRLWALYRPIQWYIYCAENYPELGFCPAYALELEGMSIPGNPKGEAVRREDPEQGPLHRTLELPLLIDALKNDDSDNFEHIQQRAALALSIAFGRNPANLVFLREEDFINLLPDSAQGCYVLRLPRIKKRVVNPRGDYLEESIEPSFSRFLIDLIKENSKQNVTITDKSGKVIANPRPLFINLIGNQSAIKSKDWVNVYNVTSSDITNLLKAFVKRKNIISPLTKSLLNITTRRLRYTLATSLAAEGISKRELARILDHIDTQHVAVYFEIAGTIITHLDKAMLKGASELFKFFKGSLIESDDEAINGDRLDKHLGFISENNPEEEIDIGVCGESNLCHLDPPYSCYLCPKFQPYKQADHEHVLTCLLIDREQRIKQYEQARLGIQLDDVIFAVAQVVDMVEKENNNE